MPEQMFYNTGIGTYVWIVTNRKEKAPPGQNPARGRPRVFRAHCAAAWATSAASSGEAWTANQTRSATSCGSMPVSPMASRAGLRQRRLRLHPRNRQRPRAFATTAARPVALFFADKEVHQAPKKQSEHLAEIIGSLATYAPFADDAKFLSAVARRLEFTMSCRLLKATRGSLELAIPARRSFASHAGRPAD